MQIGSAYRSLLDSSPVRHLLFSSLIARMPLGMNALALLLFVRAETGSFALAGLAVGAYRMASACGAPVQGALIDRFEPRWILLLAAAIQGTLLTAAVGAGRWQESALVLIVLSGLAGAFTPPVSACIRALWGRLFAAESTREAAYAMDATSQETIWVIAPLLIALLVVAVSPGAAVLAAAAFGIGGTVYFVTRPQVRQWPGDARVVKARGTALRSSGLRVLLVCAALISVSWGAIQVGLPVLAVHASTGQAAGVLLALWGLGSVVGGIVVGSRRSRSPVARRYVVWLWLSALLVAPLIGVSTLAPALVLSLIAGLTIAPLISCQWALIDRVALPGTVGEAFAWDSGVITAGMAAGTVAAGSLADGVGVWSPFVLGCLSAAAAALVAMSARLIIDRQRAAAASFARAHRVGQTAH